MEVTLRRICLHSKKAGIGFTLSFLKVYAVSKVCYIKVWLYQDIGVFAIFEKFWEWWGVY